jgi:hypothetical protein
MTYFLKTSIKVALAPLAILILSANIANSDCDTTDQDDPGFKNVVYIDCKPHNDSITPRIRFINSSGEFKQCKQCKNRECTNEELILDTEVLDAIRSMNNVICRDKDTEKEDTMKAVKRTTEWGCEVASCDYLKATIKTQNSL